MLVRRAQTIAFNQHSRIFVHALAVQAQRRQLDPET
jgi:hypothetical protein